MQLSLFEEEKKPDITEVTRHKTCSKCKTNLPETEDNFYKVWSYTSIDGSTLQHYDNKCVPCAKKSKVVIWLLKKKYDHRKYGACDCCGVDAKDVKGGKLHLDHCHVTGEYRGHLCGSCNRGLGMLGDNLTGVQNALDYLKRVESKG
tara:strand:+ start:70 stop:510 length:441 start_codon:yes stop_codon:yes gene_type:complete